MAAIFQNGRQKIFDLRYLGHYFMYDNDFDVLTHVFLVKEFDNSILEHVQQLLVSQRQQKTVNNSKMAANSP